MTKVEKIEREVEMLSGTELAAFRSWFLEHDWKAWDRQIEQDSADGRLDKIADEALRDAENGETTDL